MEKEYKYLPAIISLSAALVISIVLIIRRAASLKFLILVLAFLLGFYIIGSIFRAVLIHTRTKEEDKEPENTSEGEMEDVSTGNDDNKDNN